MTTKRRDKHSTEFGLWLREQPEIDSYKGYRATNLDFIWKNDNNGKWMLIEEKRYMSAMRPWQKKMFDMIDFACADAPGYEGFHFVQFEKTSPIDGKTFIDGRCASRNDVINWLLLRSGQGSAHG
jgi:hypothetical protein